MWSNNYIGITYKANGRDRNGLDCWGLARLIYSEQFHIDLPSFDTNYHIDDNERIKELIAQYSENWQSKESPEEGDIVLFRILGEETHLGVCISSTHFIHVREGMDVAIESLENPKWNRRISGYFKYSSNSGILMNAVPHPLKTERVTVLINPGTTLDTVYNTVITNYSIPKELCDRIHILVNGIPVPRETWAEYRLQATDVVEYRAVAGKSAARMVLTLVVAYIAFQIVGPGAAELFAGYSGTGAMTVGQATISATAAAATLYAGSYLINAILPIRPPSEPADPGSSERQLMVEGGRNAFNPYGAIPVVLGKVRLTPPQGARTYVEYGTSGLEGVATRDSYLKMLLIWGYGPLYIDENTLRIGDTPLSSYDLTSNGGSIVTLNRISEPTTLQLNEFDAIYSEDVTQIFIGSELTYQGQAVTSEDITYREEEFGTVAERGRLTTTYTIGSEVGWTSRVITKTAQNGLDYGADRVVISLHFPMGLRRIETTGGNAGKSLALKVKFGVRIRYSTGINTWTSWTNLLDFEVSGAEKDAVTYNIAYEPADKTKTIEVAVRRLDPDLEEDGTARNYSKAFLQTITAYRPNLKPCIDPPRPVGTKFAKTALKIKANENLNGQIDGINAIVQTYCRVWNGTNWNTFAATSNPAALFLYVLTHPGNPQRVESTDELSKINFGQLQYWYNYCQNYQIAGVNRPLQYNGVLGQQKGVLEVLRDICAAGRASPALVDGRWSVVIDEPRNLVVQHFTPHNSWGFESTKALPRLPDALKVTFYDETSDYQEKEIIVPAAGKDSDSAELFESITLPGITNEILAEDFARWHYAQIKLRPEVYTLNTDIEYLVCNRGDRVKVTHDVPLWGLGSGRIKNRITSTIFELDEQLPIKEINTGYSLRVRGSSGSSTTGQLKTSFSVINYSVINNIVTLTIDGSAHPIQVGDSLDINTNISAINTDIAIITGITATTISYQKTATTIGQTTCTGNVILKDGLYKTIELQTALTVSQANSGDIFMFGELNKESQDLIVISIEPTNSQKNARLTLVDYGVTDTYNIFTGYRNLTGIVYSPNITLPPELLINSLGTLQPVITTSQVASDESTLEVLSPGVFRCNIRVPFTNPLNLPVTIEYVEGQIERTFVADAAGSSKLQTVPLTAGSITFKDVEESKEYRFRLRYITSDGRIGLWTNWVSHTVVGKTTAPSNVVGLTRTVKELGVEISWNASTDPDYKHTELRYAEITEETPNPDWALGLPLFKGPANKWIWPEPDTGNWRIFAKHVDVLDNESTTASQVDLLNWTSTSVASLVVEVTNPGLVTTDAAGNNPVLTGSGTNIQLYQGNTLLKYDGVGTANGRWRISTKVDGSGIVSGAIASVVDSVAGDNQAVVGNLTGFTATDSSTVTYTIVGKTTTGKSFTITKVHRYTKTKNGANGATGTKFITISCFNWLNTSLTVAPSATATYNWSAQNVTGYPTTPSTWSASAPSSPGTGYTLYRLDVVVSAAGDFTESTPFNWSSASINIVGFRQDGAQGKGARVAFIVTTSNTAPAITSSTVSGDSLPTTTGGTWSTTATSNLSAGDYLYQVDGLYDPVANTTTWGNPYLSNLKVGSLSALAVNTGQLTIDLQGSIKSSNNTGFNTAGIFLGYDTNNYKFSVVSGSNKLTFDGTNLTVTGTVSAGSFITGSVQLDNSSGTSLSTIASNASSALSGLTTKLEASTSYTLTGVVGLQDTGGIRAGTVTWNSTTGAVTGGSGVVLTENGLTGVKNGVPTFSINTNGDATFAGSLNAATGTFAGTLSAVGGSFTGTMTVGTDNTVFKVNSDGSFQSGHATFASAPFRVTNGGVLTATSATITGTLAAGSFITGSVQLDNSSGTSLSTIASNASSALSGLTTKLDKQTTYILGTTSASNEITLKTSGYDGGNGIVITNTGILGKKNNTTTFAIDNAGNATFSGDITGATGTFGGSLSAVNGSLNSLSVLTDLRGGNYTGYTWPASGLSGFYLSPSGFLLGNYNDSSRSWLEFQTGANGYLAMGHGAGNKAALVFNNAGLSINFAGTNKFILDNTGLTIDGKGTFSGTLSAATGSFSGTITASGGTIGAIEIYDAGTEKGIRSTNYSSTNGFAITNNGFAVFRNANIGGINVSSSQIYSTNYNGTTGTGFQIANNGYAEFFNVKVKGEIAAGGLDVGTGNVRGGKSSYNDNTAGFFLGNSGGTYAFSIGTSSKNMKWDGSDLYVTGGVISGGSIASSVSITFSSFTASINGGDHNASNVSLNSTNTVSRTASPSGGTSPYSYQWLVAYQDSEPPGVGTVTISNSTSATATINTFSTSNSAVLAQIVCYITDANGRIASAGIVTNVSFGSGPP